MKEEGLTQKEVLKRIEKGQVNQSSFKKTKTIKEIRCCLNKPTIW